MRRGAFAVIGDFRLLALLLFLFVICSRPLKNKLYFSLALSSAALAFACVNALTQAFWAEIAMHSCMGCALAACCFESVFRKKRPVQPTLSKQKRFRKRQP